MCCHFISHGCLLDVATEGGGVEGEEVEGLDEVLGLTVQGVKEEGLQILDLIPQGVDGLELSRDLSPTGDPTPQGVSHLTPNNSSSSSSMSNDTYNTSNTIYNATFTSILSDRLKYIGMNPEKMTDGDSVLSQKHLNQTSKVLKFLSSNKVTSENDEKNMKNKIENFYYKKWLPFCHKIFQKCFTLTQSHKNVLPDINNKIHDHNLATRG